MLAAHTEDEGRAVYDALQPELSRSAAELGAKLDDLSMKIEALRKALGGLHEEILAAMAALRVTVDAIEKVVSDESWPLPKYREMLFVY